MSSFHTRSCFFKPHLHSGSLTAAMERQLARWDIRQARASRQAKAGSPQQRQANIPANTDALEDIFSVRFHSWPPPGVRRGVRPSSLRRESSQGRSSALKLCTKIDIHSSFQAVCCYLEVSSTRACSLLKYTMRVVFSAL